MNIFYKSTLMISLLILLFGCASNNISRFRPDPLDTPQIQQSITEKLAIKNVIMNKGNKNSIMCRMVGNIYLPDKVSYSQYVEQVCLHASLISHIPCAQKAQLVRQIN